MVVNFIRHGARAILKPDKKKDIIDLFNLKIAEFDRGDDQLTTKGQMQLYNLGLFHRLKYVITKKFLPIHYDRNEIFIMTTDKPRTVDSAHSYLNGLYGKFQSKYVEKNNFPPIGAKAEKNLITLQEKSKTIKNDNYTPTFPIINKIVPKMTDSFIGTQVETMCNGNFKKIQEIYGQKDTPLKQKLINYINENNISFKPKELAEADKIIKVYEFHDEDLSYLDPKLRKAIELAGNWYWQDYVFLGDDVDQLVKYTLKSLKNYVHDYQNGTGESRKFNSFFTHDIIVHSLAKYFKVDLNESPVFAEFLTFELYSQKKDKKYYFKIKYNNNKYIKISLDEFEKNLKELEIKPDVCLMLKK